MTTKMKLRSLGRINEEESKGLDYSRRGRNAPYTSKQRRCNRLINNHNNLIDLQALGFYTTATFANKEQFNQLEP